MKSILIALFFVSTVASANAALNRTMDETKAELHAAAYDLDALALKTDLALLNLVKKAAVELDDQSVLEEYNEFYASYVHNDYLGLAQNIGDHKPLSKWLADLYDRLENTLGVEVCKFFHFIDIKILNYGIPVVFHPTGYNGETWNLQDYQDHFGGHMKSKFFFEYDGVCGVTAFWVSYGVCEGATWGTGTALLCSTLANAIEWGTDKYISPKASKAIYCKKNVCE